MLNFENLDVAEVFSLCFSFLELMISIIGIVGGVSMVSVGIVVGLGCYGGIPNNRAMASKPEAIPTKEFEDKPSGFDSRTSTNCGFVRTRKPQSKGYFAAFYQKRS